jgi:hypothetical protein
VSSGIVYYYAIKSLNGTLAAGTLSAPSFEVMGVPNNSGYSCTINSPNTNCNRLDASGNLEPPVIAKGDCCPYVPDLRFSQLDDSYPFGNSCYSSTDDTSPNPTINFSIQSQAPGNVGLWETPADPAVGYALPTASGDLNGLGFTSGTYSCYGVEDSTCACLTGNCLSGPDDGTDSWYFNFEFQPDGGSDGYSHCSYSSPLGGDTQCSYSQSSIGVPLSANLSGLYSGDLEGDNSACDNFYLYYGYNTTEPVSGTYYACTFGAPFYVVNP